MWANLIMSTATTVYHTTPSCRDRLKMTYNMPSAYVLPLFLCTISYPPPPVALMNETSTYTTMFLIRSRRVLPTMAHPDAMITPRGRTGATQSTARTTFFD